MTFDDLFEPPHRREHLVRGLEDQLSDLGQMQPPRASLEQANPAPLLERSYVPAHHALRELQLARCCGERTAARYGDEDGKRGKSRGAIIVRLYRTVSSKIAGLCEWRHARIFSVMNLLRPASLTLMLESLAGGAP